MTDNTTKPIFGRLFNRLRSSREEDQSSANSKEHLIYAIGDIHGRHDLLVDLIEKIRVDTVATLRRLSGNHKISIVFLGDYIDRGHQSREVLESLSALTFSGTELIFLKGNHEEAALNFLDGGAALIKWLDYGGKETLSSYGIEVPKNTEGKNLLALREKFADAIPDHHLAFLRGLKSYWISGEYLFVHAGIDPAKPLEAQTDKEFLWIRDPFLKSIRKLPYIVVHGHTPEEKPVWDGRRIGVDTGAYITRRLTAAKLYGGDVMFLST